MIITGSFFPRGFLVLKPKRLHGTSWSLRSYPINPFFHSDSMLWVAHPFALFAKGWDSECTRQTRDPSSHAGARALPHRDLLPSLTGSRRVGKPALSCRLSG